MRMILGLLFVMGLASAAEGSVKLGDFQKGGKEVKVQVVSGADVTLKTGATFKVSLESNPSTGYAWRQ